MTPPRPAGAPRIAVLVDSFPELSETFVTAECFALQEAGARIRVEAIGRAARPDPARAAGLDARYFPDDGTRGRLRDLLWLVRRAPRACLRDLRDRRRWAREEEPLPLRAIAPAARRVAAARDDLLLAHFGVGAALTAMRIARLLGVPYAVTFHGYDIFQSPRNLPEKVAGAAFVTSGSDYTVRHLRATVPAHAGKIHKIVMGVDPEAWRRSAPPAEGGLVVAVGRLVEKKGFSDLLDAAALMAGDPAFERLVIAGSGPLEDDLRARRAALGLEDRVELAGGLVPAEVRALMERAAVVAIPCVVAADGDRDSMPVVAKEALALEVPVVATDVCGLPEVVAPPWGVLVAPHAPRALADALLGVLRLAPDERARLGAEGRRFVAARCTVAQEASGVLALVAAARRGT